MHSIANPSESHPSKGGDRRVLSSAIVAIIKDKPGSTRSAIALALGAAFDRPVIMDQLRAMLSRGELIEQFERGGTDPRCYLIGQKRPHGDVLQCDFNPVTRYVDRSVCEGYERPSIGAVGKTRMATKQPLSDIPRRSDKPPTETPRKSSIPPLSAARRLRLNAIAGKIATLNQRLKKAIEAREQIERSGIKAVEQADSEALRGIVADRVAADLRAVDRNIAEAQGELTRQIGLKTQIEKEAGSC